jgi:hypothetical protein
MDSKPSTSSLQASYDTVAAEYARRIFDELAGKPFDRRLLDDFAALVTSSPASPDPLSSPCTAHRVGCAGPAQWMEGGENPGR